MPARRRGRGHASDDGESVRFLVPGDMDSQPPELATEDLEPLRVRSRRSHLLVGAAALALVSGLAVTGRIWVERTTAPASVPSHAALAPIPTHAPDVSLKPLRHYVVSDIAVRTGEQVLDVAFQPTPTVSHDGGTVTLYAARRFAARMFLTTAKRTFVGGHVAYFGSYQHQSAVAWPVRGGRWVCLTGFIGTGNGTDPDVSRSEELAIAPSVVVR